MERKTINVLLETLPLNWTPRNIVVKSSNICLCWALINLTKCDDWSIFKNIFYFAVLFITITITGCVGVIPPQRPPASPHLGCQGLPRLDMQKCKISYNIQYIY